MLEPEDAAELLLGALVEPPEDAAFSLSLSLSASVVAELELDALGAPAEGVVLGLVALGELELLELALPPALGELAGGGVDGVDDALLLEPDAPGAVEVRSLRASSPQAASPRANATATANVESLMCLSMLNTRRRSANIGPRVSP